MSSHYGLEKEDSAYYRDKEKQIEFEFSVDEEGMVSVSVLDLKTKTYIFEGTWDEIDKRFV